MESTTVAVGRLAQRRKTRWTRALSASAVPANRRALATYVLLGVDDLLVIALVLLGGTCICPGTDGLKVE